jgi:F0F1-type ATP synthase assembly protein I
MISTLSSPMRVISASVISISLTAAIISPVTAADTQAVAFAPNTWSQGVGTSISGKTNVERAMGKCVGSVLGGALLGALVGAAAGNTKSGLIIGTAVGAGVCAVLMKAASNKDKMALRNVQLQAANSGMISNASWTSEQGNLRNAIVTPSAVVPLVVGQNGSYRCRTDNTCLVDDKWVSYETLTKTGTGTALTKVAYTPVVYKCLQVETKYSVEGVDAKAGGDKFCLVNDTWVTGDKLKKLNIREDDIVT